MSYDRKLDWVCPHYVVDEALFLSADRVTVRPLRPISAANSVKVRLDGATLVGPAGVAVPAEVVGSRRGPFTIQAGVNDTLVVRTHDGQVQTVAIPAGKALEVGQIVAALMGRITGVLPSVTLKQKVKFETQHPGPHATMMFLPGSTLATALGIDINRQWRGRQTVPGWSLVNDPNTLPDRPTRHIIFDAPLKGFREFVEINYATLRQECRRCGGIGVENDWRYNRTGEVVQVVDEALLIQEFQKAVYTVQGSNSFFPSYGTRILESIGTKMGAGQMAQQFIAADIRDAFRRWQKMKREQEDKVGQFVSDSEFPFALTSVNAIRDQDDPTVVYVSATVQSRSTKPIKIERGVRVPLPDDLLGSSAQEGLVRQSLSKFVKNG